MNSIKAKNEYRAEWRSQGKSVYGVMVCLFGEISYICVLLFYLFSDLEFHFCFFCFFISIQHKGFPG